MSLLVISAAQFEAEPSLRVLERRGLAFEYFETGVGPLRAAKSEARLLKACAGKDLLYIGSCGSFYPFTSLHLVTVDRVFWMPPCLRTGIAHYPELFQEKPYTVLPSDLDLPRKSVLTTPSISLVDHIHESVLTQLPPRDVLVENMELYTCMDALLQGRSLRILLGVTNGVGPEGSAQWSTHFRQLAHMTADFVQNLAF